MKGGPEKAWAVVRDWITSAGQVPTDERIEALLPVAWRWAPVYRRAAIRLVAAGTLPTRAAVAREVQRHNAARAAKRRDTGAALAAGVGPDAAAWIRRYLDHHGHGPMWSELGRALELSARQQKPAIEALHRDGWVTSTLQTRSLRPGPRAEPTPDTPATGTEPLTDESASSEITPGETASGEGYGPH